MFSVRSSMLTFCFRLVFAYCMLAMSMKVRVDEVKTDNIAVSYTHLDVYKRQD